MATIELIQLAWKRFDDLKNTAEQYMFLKLAFWDFQLTPLYNDLCVNWDDHNAEIFLKGMDVMFKSFDLPTIDEWRKAK